MKYIEKYENFKPIKINNDKPFKIKKNLPTSINYLQKRIKSLKGRISKEKDIIKRGKMNNDLNSNIKKLGELTHYQLKQANYLKNNPVTENVNTSDNNDTENLISVLESKDFKPDDILKYIGFDENEITIDEFDESYIELIIDPYKLEDLMNIEHNIINYILQITSYYSSYEYTINDDESDYLSHYLSDDVLNMIKKLSILFNHEINPNEDEAISNLFEYLGLKDNLENYMSEISQTYEKEVSNYCKDLLKSLPFDIEFAKDKNFKLTFIYEDVIDYMKTNDINVKTIKELIENVDSSDINYEFEDEAINNYSGDFKELNRIVYEDVDNYLKFPDEIFPKIIAVDNIDTLVTNLKLADFTDEYDVWIYYKKENNNLFELAKYYNGKILELFKTYNFQKKIIDNSEIDIYNALKESEIIDPKIEKEFEHLINIEKYNM